eukprot:3939460-Rhodomonas_salina.4
MTPTAWCDPTGLDLTQTVTLPLLDARNTMVSAMETAHGNSSHCLAILALHSRCYYLTRVPQCNASKSTGISLSRSTQATAIEDRCGAVL